MELTPPLCSVLSTEDTKNSEAWFPTEGFLGDMMMPDAHPERRVGNSQVENIR